MFARPALPAFYIGKITMLYQPHRAEITPLTQKAIQQWPQLRTRIQAAELILSRPHWGHDIRYREQWQVRSQFAGCDQWYAINFDGQHATCSCFDHTAGKYNKAADRIFCKHQIAWLTYRELLTQRLNHHLQVGTFQIERLLIDHYLRGELDSVAIVQDGTIDWWKFANVYSMATLAAWLGQRQAQGIEPQCVAPTREKSKIEIVDYPIHGKLDPECADATCMSYEDWREIYGHKRSDDIGEDESRRPYAY